MSSKNAADVSSKNVSHTAYCQINPHKCKNVLCAYVTPEKALRKSILGTIKKKLILELIWLQLNSFLEVIR